jgi:hypothetical protein
VCVSTRDDRIDHYTHDTNAHGTTCLRPLLTQNVKGKMMFATFFKCLNKRGRQVLDAILRDPTLTPPGHGVMRPINGWRAVDENMAARVMPLAARPITCAQKVRASQYTTMRLPTH